MPKRRVAKKRVSQRVERTRNSGKWTEARFKSFIVGVMDDTLVQLRWWHSRCCSEERERGLEGDS